MKINFNEITPVIKENFKGGEGIFRIQGAGDDLCKINRITIDPHSNNGYHSHVENCEVIYVIEGVATIVEGEEKYQVQPGEVTYCPAGAYHAVRNDEDVPLVLLGIIPEHHK